MKILFPIGAFYPSQIGGPCNTLYWHTVELVNNQFEVSIVTTTLGIENNKVIPELDLLEPCGKVYYGKGNSFNFKTIIKAIKESKKAEIVHLNSLFDLLSITTFFYIRFFTSKKIIWSTRGELNENALKFGVFKKKILLSIYRKFNKKVYFHSTSLKETKEIELTFPKVSIFQIPNLILPSKRITSELKNQFVYVGRIHPIKAIHKLIEALSICEEFMNSNFIFLVIGKHEDRHLSYFQELKELVKEKKLSHKIEFKGHISGTEKEKIYSESYFTFLPSETENFGNVVIESLNQGTPVCASLGTPWEILNDYKCGFHCSNNPPTIAETISKIITMTDNKYLEFRANSIKLVEQEFHVKNQIYKWVETYNKLYNV